MAVSAAVKSQTSGSKVLNIALWVAQVLIALAFVLIGYSKLTTPIEELSKMMVWTGQYPKVFVRSIGIIDMAGGLGVLLPSVSRILPRLTVIAAICCIALQFLAISFHISRGEAAATPPNFVFLALVIFIAWGRGRKVPIMPRR